ncbi:hypothetical protein [Helicobacter macacae]|uniref:Uncharacterized protein n=1 Tax=Helicobacter macacae MIT 99-5501 TaxID=1357400 RepID=V8CA42_9HELI|nr:hypothetical protein [Helicobacter macacae]ETD23601.1 hypothetical protein HMPREF2086_01407 [Helicobacter macacae MIT 99-5501]
MIRISYAYSHETVRGGGVIPQHKSYLVKNIFSMKKFAIFFCLFFVETIYADTLTCRGAGTNATLTCSGAGYTGQCVLSGEGYCYVPSNLNIETLTVIGGALPAALGLTAQASGNNRIGKIIIQRKSGTAKQLSLNAYNKQKDARLTVGDIVLGGGVDETNALVVRFSSFTVSLENTGLSKDATGAYIPRKETSGTGGGGGGNQGGEFTPPENATPEQLLQSVIKYAQALNEQLHLESTNTLILYNILNNYDGTYINYDYGLGHQVGIGAFNNGGFARYYNYNSKNGFDIGAKLKIAVANKLYLRGVAYYTYFGSSTLASHSLVFGLGVLKNFDFTLGSSGNVFWVLNPSANLYYAATLKGTYMPANHLGFGNVALDTGVRIKNTSLLLRGSAGGVLNSLKSIGIDLGNGANYKNTTFFNNAIYSASFVFSQKFPLQNHNGRFYLNADIGGVFVDRVLDSITNKPYILKAGMLLGYEFGGDSNRATRQSSRYQKLKNKNARKTLSAPTSNQTTTNNKRATSLAPKADSTNNAKSTPLAKTPAKDSNKSQKPELTKAEKKAQKQAQKEAQKAQKKAAKAAKSTPPKSTPPKINLPKVPKSSAKQSAKQNTKPTKPTTKPTNAKSSAKPAKPTAKPSTPTKPTKQTKPKK